MHSASSPRVLALLALLAAVPTAHALPPKPWEGSDSPTPYTVVNTRTGTPTTVLPLTGWKGRGLSTSLSLFHTPDVSPPGGLWRDNGWSHTYSTCLGGQERG